jgi:hypothetical protein
LNIKIPPKKSLKNHLENFNKIHTSLKAATAGSTKINSLSQLHPTVPKQTIRPGNVLKYSFFGTSDLERVALNFSPCRRPLFRPRESLSLTPLIANQSLAHTTEPHHHGIEDIAIIDRCVRLNHTHTTLSILRPFLTFQSLVSIKLIVSSLPTLYTRTHMAAAAGWRRLLEAMMTTKRAVKFNECHFSLPRKSEEQKTTTTTSRESLSIGQFITVAHLAPK